MQLNCNNVLFKLLKASPQKIFFSIKRIKRSYMLKVQ